MEFYNARGVLILCTTLVLAGCGGSPASTSESALAPPALKPALSSVPSCDGQHTKKDYSAFSARLKRTGGSFCIPLFAGFGGSINYPHDNRSAQLTMRTSTQNLYYEPSLGTTGTPFVYLNLHFHSGTRFGSKLESGGGLTSQAIVAGNTYTAYGIVGVGNLILRFPPCFAVATQGQYGGVFPNIGNLFSGTTITGNGYGVIEVYAGQQVSQAC